jgi:hypothetical protein
MDDLLIKSDGETARKNFLLKATDAGLEGRKF